MSRDPIDSFIETYVQALHDQNAAIFAGAGLSIPAGLVNWKELLRGVAGDIGLDVDKEEDSITVAQFHVNERGGRHRINQVLIHEFAIRSKSTDNHELLAPLPIKPYGTPNYNPLLRIPLQRMERFPMLRR